MFWWLSPFCEALTSHHPPHWAPAALASLYFIPPTLLRSSFPIHGTLLKGSALFLQNKDHHLEHCTLGNCIVLLLFNAYLPHRMEAP